MLAVSQMSRQWRWLAHLRPFHMTSRSRAATTAPTPGAPPSAVSLDSASHTPRLVAYTYTYNGPTEIVCQGNVCPPEPVMPPPHLIWTPAP